MLTLHRLFLRSAGIVFIAATLLFSAEPAMADSSGYQGARYSGSSRGLRNYRGGSARFIRPHSARYNRWYSWHREYSGNRYDYYGSYGNRYPGDTYRYQDDTISEDADLLSDIDYSDIGLGWLLLAKGEAHKALKTFSVQKRKNPNNSILKVGYALAAAETGDLHKGVSAMRGALRSDPDALHNLSLDEDLQGIVKDLIHRYEDEHL